jgi:hypothetical protein
LKRIEISPFLKSSTRGWPRRWPRRWRTAGGYGRRFPHLEAPWIKLEGITTETGELLLLQADLTAKKQQVSKRLEVLVADGRQLAAFLRAGVKQHYGTRSEKLSAFNLQPFRGRKAASPEKAAKKKKLQEETPAAAAPETSTE